MSRFQNRVVLITGASGALGKAVTSAFLDAGAHVAGAARTAPAIQHERFTAIAADLTVTEGAAAAVEQALRVRNRLDALVHVMGGFAMDGPVHESSESTWDHLLNLNLRSAFLVLRAALPPMIEAGYGRIAAVGSRAGADPGPGLAAYNVSKAGLHTLIRTVAAEVRPHNITANVVLPSTIDTPANREAMPKADFSKWVRPDSIASMILHLCSDEAADTSGALVPVYGKS